MTELNLLKYLDLSFSEIYQIEHGEIEQEIETNVQEIEETKKVGKKFPTYFLLIIILVIVLVASALSYFFIFDKPKPKKNTKPIVKKEIQKPTNIKLNQDFVEIGTITFSKKENITINQEKENLKSIKHEKALVKQIDNKPKTKKEIKPITTNIKYFAIYENINKNELIKLKKELFKENLKYEVDKTKLINKKYWYLYKQSPTGKTIILNRKVNFIKMFQTKSKAIDYAKKYNIPAIIVEKNLKERHYFIKVYYFKSKKQAIKFVRNNKFKGKTVKIIKFSS